MNVFTLIHFGQNLSLMDYMPFNKPPSQPARFFADIIEWIQNLKKELLILDVRFIYISYIFLIPMMMLFLSIWLYKPKFMTTCIFFFVALLALLFYIPTLIAADKYFSESWNLGTSIPFLFLSEIILLVIIIYLKKWLKRKYEIDLWEIIKNFVKGKLEYQKRFRKCLKASKRCECCSIKLQEYFASFFLNLLFSFCIIGFSDQLPVSYVREYPLHQVRRIIPYIRHFEI